MTVWADCKGENHIKPLSGCLFRLVESQEQVATRSYVDTMEEQFVLEELLEQSKPPYPGKSQSLHYLLKTPFRYPPLPWGSRFGQQHEPSLFYGGCSVEVTLAESAFYRLVHINSMEGEAPKTTIRSEHTLFSVRYKTKQGIQLQAPPFDQYRDQLTHLSNYSVCQRLGSDMREAGVGLFEYLSARSMEEGVCVAIYTPESFSQKRPANMDHWFCECSAEGVVFKQSRGKPVYFPASQFLEEGVLPLPA
ncbi:RES family NAD+ phosphorylase [Motiliproteus sp. MSK22-1]|uniref:RES family NAD+ phosphorylase n=1 Tax=Motiliproteus sp. MSK22-1 TaxID=1897630 RepID=UPI0009755124|nr:RES family NAD+ phosphorylase [Motiliproteus sp. MSK22-1]OMH29058.1 hypothetical protein BGP75_20085 [Motiliproteus sp. MSK22-1]